METLAYLHLATANEAPLDIDYSAWTATGESLKQFGRSTLDYLWTQKKLSTTATVSLVSLTLSLTLLGMATQALAVVQQGDRGEEVTAVQQRLQQLGYYKTTVTGYFGSLTKEAVIQFQQAKGLVPDGIVGANTLAAMGGQPQPTSKSGKLPSPKPVTETSVRILRLGDKGRQVNVLQESLAAAGFPGRVNGIFDEATQKVVMRFQQAKGLTVDGVVGPQTWAALPAVGGSNPSSRARNTSNRTTSRNTGDRTTPKNTSNRTNRTNSANRSTPRTTSNRTTSVNSANRSTPRTTSNRTTSVNSANRSTPRTASNPTSPSNSANRSTPTATAIRLNPPSNVINLSTTGTLQKRLKELGFYSGAIDGIWGPQTQAAVEAAQRAYGVKPSDIAKGSL
ncbi:MAG: peptidoglycan-binding protein [Cyanobacteriota bacterium]